VYSVPGCALSTSTLPNLVNGTKSAMNECPRDRVRRSFLVRLGTRCACFVHRPRKTLEIATSSIVTSDFEFGYSR
jgi:hypothetical protein